MVDFVIGKLQDALVGGFVIEVATEGVTVGIIDADNRHAVSTDSFLHEGGCQGKRKGN